MNWRWQNITPSNGTVDFTSYWCRSGCRWLVKSLHIHSSLFFVVLESSISQLFSQPVYRLHFWEKDPTWNVIWENIFFLYLTFLPAVTGYSLFIQFKKGNALQCQMSWPKYKWLNFTHLGTSQILDVYNDYNFFMVTAEVPNLCSAIATHTVHRSKLTKLPLPLKLVLKFVSCSVNLKSSLLFFYKRSRFCLNPILLRWKFGIYV